ncbi:MAG: 30S ribosomal protein S12 methylthiotransferase RimO [Planctomycetota bacterium]
MRPISLHLVSLGCPKNLVDSEVILGRVGAEGFIVTPDPETADVLMVNTCGFIDAAKQESVDQILELVSHKEEDPAKRVVVAGCLGQRYPEELRAEIPEIDAIVGLSEYSRMPEILTELVSTARLAHPVQVSEPNHPAYSEGSRLRLTPNHSAYLRISEGCDNPCTFCSIPGFRRRFRSKPVEMVLEEARELIESGATEVNLISQDLTSFGSDIDGDYHLSRLLGELDALPGVRWIRLLYTYPYKFSDAMVDAVAQLERVIPYIDMPIQHIDDLVLKRMGRRMGEAGTVDLFRRMRERIEDLVLRTTFIVGFPGETEEQFGKLVDFVREMHIERVGVFPYSDEDGTPAARLPEKIAPEIAAERVERLMLAQQEIAFAWNDRRVGDELDVLIDGWFESEQGARLTGRSYAEAPEIDSRIFLPDAAGAPGDYVRAVITGVEDYDLTASPVEGA